MREILKRWQHQRILKGLGQLEPGHLSTSLKFDERRQADAMPQLIQYNFVAASWILAKQKRPSVRGGLWQREGRMS